MDEDYKRYYPYHELASTVLGFTGGDNQGIIGLEVKYEDWLAGTDGKILTVTDARGVELDKIAEGPIGTGAGKNIAAQYGLQYSDVCAADALRRSWKKNRQMAYRSS